MSPPTLITAWRRTPTRRVGQHRSGLARRDRRLHPGHAGDLTPGPARRHQRTTVDQRHLPPTPRHRPHRRTTPTRTPRCTQEASPSMRCRRTGPKLQQHQRCRGVRVAAVTDAHPDYPLTFGRPPSNSIGEVSRGLITCRACQWRTRVASTKATPGSLRATAPTAAANSEWPGPL